jgi:hypothetical protein
MNTRRILTTLTLAAALLAAVAAPAWAGSPHFVGDPTISRTGDALTVTFKVAGLGNEDQTITLTADASCVNPGNNEPKAENKGDVVATGTFSPKNGNVVGSLSGTGSTDPSCSPPMRLGYSNVVLTDTTAGISYTFPGTF